MQPTNVAGNSLRLIHDMTRDYIVTLLLPFPRQLIRLLSNRRLLTPDPSPHGRRGAVQLAHQRVPRIRTRQPRNGRLTIRAIHDPQSSFSTRGSPASIHAHDWRPVDLGRCFRRLWGAHIVGFVHVVHGVAVLRGWGCLVLLSLLASPEGEES